MLDKVHRASVCLWSLDSKEVVNGDNTVTTGPGHVKKSGKMATSGLASSLHALPLLSVPIMPDLQSGFPTRSS